MRGSPPMARLGNAAPVALLALLVPLTAPAPPAAEPEALDGQLTLVWADPRPGASAAADTEYWLYQRGGRRVRLDVADHARGSALKLDRQQVRVRGRSLPPHAAASGRSY